MANHLAGETSPYLLQHADNPVDWWPWDEQALTLAKQSDKPILLSIGYSACHWCHVMAHESFENKATAAVMNDLFVNIKVDREERPDLDQIYQSAYQLLTGRPGGWPLTMFLTPDGTPFYGGTYFPAAPRHGLPAFTELCRDVAEAYRCKRGDIDQQNRELKRLLAATIPRVGSKVSRGGSTPQAGRDALLRHYDARWGGFGGAPKFPHTGDLLFLLRRAGDARARDAVLTTLTRMAEGGIYDQLGGGFFRYSVDERWEIPHFEKMLYDNGPLLGLYAEAWALRGDPLFARVAAETADWAIRDMQLPAGGFASSLDADSEHEEGRYYVWDRDEIRSLLDDNGWRVARDHWGLDDAPNFEGMHWHLNVVRPPAPGDEHALCDVRARLRVVRDRRVPPGRDDKALTSWNAVMIKGLARAGRIFARPDWVAAARRALVFIRTTLWRDGRLAATWRGGHAYLAGYLDDYALLLLAVQELMMASPDAGDADLATQLGNALLEHFEDKADGGFFFTAHDHETLIHRPKPVFDNNLPGGNAAAALGLLRLGGECHVEAAMRTLRLFEPQVDGGGAATLLMALEQSQSVPACTEDGCAVPSLFRPDDFG